MSGASLKFLKKPFVDDNSEFLVLAEILFDESEIIRKLKDFAQEEKERLKKDGARFNDCDVCEKEHFLAKAIKGKKYLLLRRSCLIRDVLNLSRIVEFAEGEGLSFY